uniref:Putative NAC domain class transcription factor n=1 Tax=Tamarix hispida TaxID=189793 RepID=T2CBK4_9CARY|nr:putative NAC domain class transcription factor [Tamarix hispida]
MIQDLDCFGCGDYLEMKDLVVPHSSSSSSVNSSRQSVSSNEFFDDFLELADLPENNQENKPKSTGHNYRIPASSAFTEVVLPPATEGTLVQSVTMDAPPESLKAGNTAPDPAAKEGKVPDQGGSKHGGQSCARKGLPSNLKDHVVAPSSGENSVPMEQKKGEVMKKKGWAWYFNCWPF